MPYWTGDRLLGHMIRDTRTEPVKRFEAIGNMNILLTPIRTEISIRATKKN